MDCKQAQNQIPAYRASALDIADRRALECHLSGCPECAGVFAGADASLRAGDAITVAVAEPEPAQEVR